MTTVASRSWMLALALSAAAVMGDVQLTSAQTANGANGLRTSLDDDAVNAGREVPLTDDNLNGIDDADEQQPDLRAVFPDPVETSSTDEEDDDDGRNRRAGRTSTRAQAINSFEAESDNDSGVGNTRAIRAQQVGTINAAGEPTPLSNSPAFPIEGSRQDPEDDPFAPLGLRLGSFDVFPSIEQDIGYTSNADFTANGEGAAFSQTRGQVRFQSNWARHELRGQVGGAFQKFLGSDADDLPTADAEAELRIDINRDLVARAGFFYALTTESPTSENLGLTPPFNLEGRPFINDIEGYGELAYNFGRWSTSFRGSVTRTTFGDIEITGNPDFPQDDRNNFLYLGTLRASYQVSPAFRPYIQGSAGARSHDTKVDRNGNERDSSIYEVQAGFDFNLGEKLNGTIGAGFRAEDFDDEALSTLSSPLIAATLNWSPERLTTISTTLSSTLAGSILEDENGSVVHAASIGYAREVRPNLGVNGRLFGSFRDYDASDREDIFLQAELGAEWRLNRVLSLTGRVGYERALSTEESADYDAFTVRAGVRLIR
ncbi:MAG: outer membrane beta-barrel protein [Pseudomonadota bacterium]